MALKYTLHENRMINGQEGRENEYVARTVGVKMNNFEHLLEEVTGPGSILKDTETRAVIAAYWGKIIGFLEEGEGYRDEYISLKTGISGVFNGEEDRFDDSRHSLVLSLVPGAPLKATAQEVDTQYVKPELNVPILETVYDWGSDTYDEKLTPGNILEIKGEELKLYEEVPGQGVFFVQTSTGQETLAPQVRTNEPRTLTVRTPALAAGTYRVEVRNTTRVGKTLRKGAHQVELEVNGQPQV